MREIKFKYYLEETNEMLPVYSMRIDDNNFSMIHIKLGDCFHAVPVTKFNRKYLVQYTGLKDKNGKEIYEGDLFKYEDTKGLFDSGVYKVDFMDAEFVLIDCGEELEGLIIPLSAITERHCPGYEPKGDYEVIGNIYENKELLND